MDLDFIIELTTDFITTHAAYAPLIVGVLAFLESLAIVSFFVPSTVILLAIGALIAVIGLEFWPIWLGAALGALLGDFVSYYFGFRFKRQAFTMWPMRNYPNLIHDGEAFMKRHGAWGLFVGRFIGPVRSIAPLVAGVFAMPMVTFQAVSFASAMLWAFVLLAPGAGIVSVAGLYGF